MQKVTRTVLGSPIICSSSRCLALASLLGAMTMGGCSNYQPAWYDGDGQLTSMPVGATSVQHEIDLTSISLLSSERYEFRLAGLPRNDLVVILDMDEPSSEALDALEKANTRVSMTIVNNEPGVASAKRGRLLGDWRSTAASWAGTPQEFEGVWFRPRRHDSFTLVIDVQTDARVEGAFVTATPRIRTGRPAAR